MPSDARDNSDVPPGWSYNPASWGQRLPLVAVATVGFAIAMYLSLYQWRVFSHAWDPFFAAASGDYANGSERILNSSISKLLPVPDAFLGALGYVLDAITGLIGGRARWRTTPWIVILFGVFVGPLGAVSILLVILQPLLFHAWCFLCLCSAAISVAMIGAAMDEVLASLQYLRREHDAGRSVWRAFWGTSDERPVEAAPAPDVGRGHGTGWIPAAIGLLLGLWLMTAPHMLGYTSRAADSDHIVGPLAAMFAAVAIFEVTRPVRWLNLPAGIWLLIAPWIFHASTAAMVNSFAVGVLLIGCSLIGGSAIAGRYGGGWSALWRPAT